MYIDLVINSNSVIKNSCGCYARRSLLKTKFAFDVQPMRYHRPRHPSHKSYELFSNGFIGYYLGLAVNAIPIASIATAVTEMPSANRTGSYI
jgi:hypothetical protein